MPSAKNHRLLVVDLNFKFIKDDLKKQILNYSTEVQKSSIQPDPSESKHPM
jgi:hypothetical protein